MKLLSMPAHVAANGGSLWEEVTAIAKKAKTENSVDDALEPGFKVKDLEAPAVYYVKSKFGTQLLVKYNEKEFNFVGILRGADGEPVISKKDTYDISEMRAVRNFEIPDSDDGKGQPVIIAAGSFALKARTA
jgi:hypothetical protein